MNYIRIIKHRLTVVFIVIIVNVIIIVICIILFTLFCHTWMLYILFLSFIIITMKIHINLLLFCFIVNWFKNRPYKIDIWGGCGFYWARASSAPAPWSKNRSNLASTASGVNLTYLSRFFVKLTSENLQLITCIYIF